MFVIPITPCLNSAIPEVADQQRCVPPWPKRRKSWVLRYDTVEVESVIGIQQFYPDDELEIS